MASPQNSSPDNSQSSLAVAIAEVEEKLATLKARHTQVEIDKERKEQLENLRNQIKREKPLKTDLKAQLKEIETEIETIEHNLESQLFDIAEPFWQAVRFLGLGIVLGWLLKSWIG